MNNVDSKVYTDISIIISMMPNKMREKISKSFINFIENNKDTNYNSNINPKTPLNKQNIKKETKEMLGIIYRDYLCDEKKRMELLQQEQVELLKYEDKQRELYNPDNIFKNKNHTSNEEKEEIKEVLLTIKKDNLIKRIINKIKFLFRKRH